MTRRLVGRDPDTGMAVWHAYDGHGGAPDAGGFGGGFDPDTGMGPGPQGEPW